MKFVKTQKLKKTIIPGVNKYKKHKKKRQKKTRLVSKTSQSQTIIDVEKKC